VENFDRIILAAEVSDCRSAESIRHWRVA